MKLKTTHSFPASTLAELLVVMIVSGILFIGLFDGLDIVKRYGRRLGGELFSGETLLDSYQRLDHLFYTSDSVLRENGAFGFYRNGEYAAMVEFRDSLLLVAGEVYPDTLFREVAEARSVLEKGHILRVDSLYVSFIYRGKQRCFPFGLARCSGRDAETAVKELENLYKFNGDGTE